MILEELEEAIGKKASEWSREDIASIADDETKNDILIKLSTNFSELFKELKGVNDEFNDQFIAPAYYMQNITLAEESISDAIADFKNTNEVDTLLEISNDIIDNAVDPFTKLAGYLSVIYHLEDKDKLLSMESDLFNTMKESIDIIKRGIMDTYFLLMLDWAEIMYSIEEIYFEKTGIKVPDDIKTEMDSLQALINTFTVEMSEDLQKNSENKEQDNIENNNEGE